MNNLEKAYTHKATQSLINIDGSVSPSDKLRLQRMAREAHFQLAHYYNEEKKNIEKYFVKAMDTVKHFDILTK